MRRVWLFTLTSVFLVLLTGADLLAQQVAPLWQDFVNARQAGTQPILADYSYAGYHFSEIPLPDVTGRTYFNVTNYGATPNDATYDDAGIQAAIYAAEANPSGGVVFFPPGKYIISPDEDQSKYIRISKSNIVLKGSGSGVGGTEIYQDKMRIGTRQIQFRGSSSQPKITTITADSERESFWITVASTTGLSAGQKVVIKHKSEEFTRQYFSPLQLKPEWERLFGPTGGMQISEFHTIEKIEGNKVKFIDPIHFNLKLVASETFDLCAYNSLKECGLEDILFTSGWIHYPETFVHHKDGIHDSGWCAVAMEYVEDSWVRNVEFRDINETLFLRAGYKVTIIDNKYSGKKGHSAVHSRSGTGVLVKNCQFNGAHHHGPGTGYNHVGFVVTQCTMAQGQSIDSHGGIPYASLFDDLTGGVVSGLGGPEEGHPHHGRDFVGWNWVYRSNGSQTVNFWNLSKRENNTFAYPNFVGLQPNNSLTLINALRDEQRGMEVSPKSLFEAQLALRLGTTSAVYITAPASGSTFTAPATIQIHASASINGNNPAKVEFYNGATKLGEDDTSPYSLTLTDMVVGIYNITAKALDGAGGQTVSSLVKVTVKEPSSLPPPWVNSDIGGVTAAGDAGFANGAFWIKGSGADIWSTSDGFHYVYQPVSGNIELIFRLQALGNTNVWAKAGVMIRETLSPGSTHAMIVGTPTTNGISFQRRTTTGGSSASTTVPGTLPAWLRITRIGNTFTASTSTNGTSWVTVGAPIQINMAADVYVGMAVTSHNNGTLTTADITNVEVNVPNSPPSAGIVSPINNASFIPPATIVIKANAADIDGSIKKIEFFRDSTKLGEVTPGEDASGPYSITWENVASGTYSITAVAIDDEGAFNQSPAVTFRVNALPTANIISPANDSSFIAPATIAIKTEATDSDGSVKKIEFYQGTTKIGEVLPEPGSSGPYTFTWSKVAAGNYSVKAKATDDKGDSFTSSVINVKVNAVVGIGDPENRDPVLSSYPNPFTNELTVKFILKAKGQASIGLYDILGRRISDVVNQNLPAGTHYRTIDGKILPSGIYMIKLTTSDGQFNDRLYRK